jgi:hypothetical protein
MESIGASVGMHNNGTTNCYNRPLDVEKIVNLLNGVAVSDGGPSVKLPDSPSGRQLYQAILRLQQTQNNKGSTPRLSVDGHVDPGGNTLARLNFLFEPDHPPGVIPTPPPGVKSDYEGLPEGAPPFLIAAVQHNPREDDLDFSARPIRAGRIAQLRVADDKTLPTFHLKAKVLAELLATGSSGPKMFSLFESNTYTREMPVPWLADRVRNTPGFLVAAMKFETSFRANLDDQYRQGHVDYQDLVTGSGPVRESFWTPVPITEPGNVSKRPLRALKPPIVKFEIGSDWASKFVLGGIKGLEISLLKLKFNTETSRPRYAATLRYKIFDHFGINDSDCEVEFNASMHGSPGQVAMWTLQHFKRPGHTPFITVVSIDRAVDGYLDVF